MTHNNFLTNNPIYHYHFFSSHLDHFISLILCLFVYDRRPYIILLKNFFLKTQFNISSFSIIIAIAVYLIVLSTKKWSCIFFSHTSTLRSYDVFLCSIVNKQMRRDIDEKNSHSFKLYADDHFVCGCVCKENPFNIYFLDSS